MSGRSTAHCSHSQHSPEMGNCPQASQPTPKCTRSAFDAAVGATTAAAAAGGDGSYSAISAPRQRIVRCSHVDAQCAHRSFLANASNCPVPRASRDIECFKGNRFLQIWVCDLKSARYNMQYDIARLSSTTGT